MIRAIQFPDNIQNIVYRIEFYLRHPNFSNYLLYRIIRACNPIGSKTSALCSVERSLQLSLYVHRGVIFLNKQARRKTSRRNLSNCLGRAIIIVSNKTKQRWSGTKLRGTKTGRRESWLDIPVSMARFNGPRKKPEGPSGRSF